MHQSPYRTSNLQEVKGDGSSVVITLARNEAEGRPLAEDYCRAQNTDVSRASCSIAPGAKSRRARRSTVTVQPEPSCFVDRGAVAPAERHKAGRRPARRPWYGRRARSRPSRSSSSGRGKDVDHAGVADGDIELLALAIEPTRRRARRSAASRRAPCPMRASRVTSTPASQAQNSRRVAPSKSRPCGAGVRHGDRARDLGRAAADRRRRSTAGSHDVHVEELGVGIEHRPARAAGHRDLGRARALREIDHRQRVASRRSPDRRHWRPARACRP